MNILNVVSILDKSLGGGCAERVKNISLQFSDYGINTSIVTLNIGSIEIKKFKEKNIDISILKVISKRFLIPYFFLISKYKKFDIFYLYSHWSLLNYIFFLTGKYYKIPIIFCPVGTSLIFGRSKIIKHLYNLLFGNFIIKYSDYIIAVNQDEKLFLENYYKCKNKIFIIPNGIPDSAFIIENKNLFRSIYINDNSPYILFMGRLNYIKGPDLLLNAFHRIKSEFSKFKLVFVGPDEGIKTNLLQYINLNGLSDSVIFTGFLDDNLKRSALNDAFLLVIPSRKEAMSIVVLEAGAQNCPVLLTRNCGFDDISKFNAGLILNCDIESIATGIKFLLSNTHQKNEMANRLNKIVKKQYRWSIIAKEIIKINIRILDGR